MTTPTIPVPGLRVLSLAALAALVASLGFASHSMAAPAAAWKLTVTSMPTNLASGPISGSDEASAHFPQYVVVATNVGGAPSSSGATITAVLPAAVTPLAPAYQVYPYLGAPEVPCGVSGRSVTCAGIGSVQPGRAVQASIPVEVSGGPSSESSEASIAGGGAAEATATTATRFTAEDAPFGFVAGAAGLSAIATRADGLAATQAGSHPFQITIDATVTSAFHDGQLLAAGHPRDIGFDLPRGLVVNPAATPVLCTEAQLEGADCPDAAQVGAVTVLSQITGTSLSSSGLYDMVPPPGTPADLGFDAGGLGIYVYLFGGLNSAVNYEFTTSARNLLARPLNQILSLQTQLWGDPSDPGHDSMRGSCAINGGVCPMPAGPDVPLLTMPGSCRSQLDIEASAVPWEHPDQVVFRSGQLADPLGDPTPIDGCNRLGFAPAIEAKPTTNRADSPSGLDLDLHVPQSDGFEDLATANLRDVTVELPAAVQVNPAAATGLAACGSDQIALDDPAPARCPAAAKIGAVEVDSPLFRHALAGSLYVAQPYANPFGSLLAVYLAIDDEATGVAIKLAGRVEADPVSGQLTVSFSATPELPIEDVKLKLFAGPSAALKSPAVCGTYAAVARMTPWSAPEGADAVRSDPFATSVAASGSGSCPSSEAQAANQPSFDAGTVVPRAGAFSPFVLRIVREDGSQRLAAIDASLPAGLIGRLAGVPYCSDGRIAAASCPASSEVGTVDVGAGAGSAPLHLAGRVYLSGPYKGAPLSLAIVVPAVAGPFDLGDVVVRVALYVEARSARIHAVSDPLPRILRGIPLEIRSIGLELGRTGLTLNPTSCDPTSVSGSVTSVPGQAAQLSNRFQVGGCSRLGFKPRVSVRFLGPAHRGAHPRFRTVLTARPGDANLRRAAVTLPGTELLDSRHIGTICTAPQFAAGRCPSASIYGYAKAWTPLLERPLEGPVYLRAGDNRLPDLAASLKGQIQLHLIGRVDSVRGRLRNTFQALPDAPLSKIVLTMKGGKKGLLVNTGGLCARRHRARASFAGQNGKLHEIKPVVRTNCGKR